MIKTKQFFLLFLVMILTDKIQQPVVRRLLKYKYTWVKLKHMS